ncbi:MAG: TIM barrel protein [Alphaproteobacteria bacterium]|nr:TIM barrel protein [Alphaproteobacteria bacterium]
MNFKPKYSAHLGYLFTEVEFEKRFVLAASSGFSAVEAPSPYAVPATEMAEWLKRIELPYVQFGLKSGNAAAGEKGIAILPNRRAEFKASVAEGLDYAETIGVKMLHAMAGVMPQQQRTNEHQDCYLENLNYAATQAEQRGIQIIVEAMNPVSVPNYYLSTAAESAAVIKQVGHKNIGLLLDIFHTVSVGDDPIATIHQYADIISHIHIADVPNRHEPGSGTIDFTAVRQALAEINYEGFIGCEYTPAGETIAGLNWLKLHC